MKKGNHLSAVVTVKEVKNGKIDVDIRCDRCGERFVGSDEDGMFCKKRCYDADNQKAKARIEEAIKNFPLKGFPQ